MPKPADPNEPPHSRAKVEVYIHIVWATKLRAALISPALEPAVHKSIKKEAESLGCIAYAVNGMPDHVHLVVRLPSTISIAHLLKSVKGSTSRFINTHYRSDDYFRWQERYGAFSISRSHLRRVIEYVKAQKERHESGDTWPEWEEIEQEALQDEEGAQ
jgi:putative transposase